MLKQLFLPFLLFVVSHSSGCRYRDTVYSNRKSEAEKATTISSPAPASNEAEKSKQYSPSEIKAIEVARNYLETQSGKQVAGNFTVHKTNEGFSVAVIYEPAYTGGHSVILISNTFEVIKVIPGA